MDLFSKKIFFKVYLFFTQREREREKETWAGEGQREGRQRIQSWLQAPSCQHRAWRGAQTHKLQDYDLSWSRTLNQLSHPGAPKILLSYLTKPGYNFCLAQATKNLFSLFIVKAEHITLKVFLPPLSLSYYPRVKQIEKLSGVLLDKQSWVTFQQDWMSQRLNEPPFG